MKTAEQILTKHITGRDPSHEHRSWVLCAMEEYAQQENELRVRQINEAHARIGELERELREWRNGTIKGFTTTREEGYGKEH